MLPYRVQYNESEDDIQNNNLFYKNTKNAKILSNFWDFLKIEKIKVLFCIMYRLYNSYFIIFENFENL